MSSAWAESAANEEVARWQELARNAEHSYLNDPVFQAMVDVVVFRRLAEREPHIVGGYFLAMMDGEVWLFEAHAGSTAPGREEPPSSEPLAPIRELDHGGRRL